ncbi:MAG: CDP-alcohol phosphatidyltransferase family protein [Candidatus Altiarchaeota archaeon]
MVLDKYRHTVDCFLAPVAKRLPTTDPNMITLVSLVFAFLGGLSLYLSQQILLLFAFVLIFSNSYLDALDGKVAKIHGKETKRGDFLDHVGDRYADLFVLIGISFSEYCTEWIGFFAVTGVLMTSYMGTQAQALGIGRVYSGLLARVDRQVILMAAIVLQYLAISAGYAEIYGFSVLEYMMLWFALAGNITALHRAAKIWIGLK